MPGVEGKRDILRSTARAPFTVQEAKRIPKHILYWKDHLSTLNLRGINMCNNNDCYDNNYSGYYEPEYSGAYPYPGYPYDYDHGRHRHCGCRNGNRYDDFGDFIYNPIFRPNRELRHAESHRDHRRRHNHNCNFIKFREFEQHFENDSCFENDYRNREFDRFNNGYYNYY